MKKITTLLLTAAMLFVLTACGENKTPQASTSTNTQSGVSVSTSTSHNKDKTETSASAEKAKTPSYVTADGMFYYSVGDSDGEKIIVPEIILTPSDLYKCIDKIDITTENFFDFFAFGEKKLTYKQELAGSEPDEERFYADYTFRAPEVFYVHDYEVVIDDTYYYSYPGRIENGPSRIDFRGSFNSAATVNKFDINSKPTGTETKAATTLTEEKHFVAVGLPGIEDSPVTAGFADGEFMLESWSYDSDKKELTQTLKTRSDYKLEKVSGSIYVWNSYIEGYWNETPGGFKYLAINKDGTVYRLVEKLGNFMNIGDTAAEYDSAIRANRPVVLDDIIKKTIADYILKDKYKGLSVEEALEKYSGGRRIRYIVDIYDYATATK